MSQRHLLFVTGTRADFGKLKPLMMAVDADPAYKCTVFVTGMHMLSRYGSTEDEVRKCGFENIFTYINQMPGEPMESILANTVHGLSRYVAESTPDMIVVHGDRSEALAGAITGALRNILVGHIEGGELSGTIDELIRHAVTKMSHLHFVANEEAANRLRQLGERDDTIFVIGSPDIDVMVSDDLPTVEEAKARYEISFDDYGVILFHPVTTEFHETREQAKALVDAALESGLHFVVVYPNNDPGAESIFEEYDRFLDRPEVRMFPSIRFEYFLALLSGSAFILGNSSAGIREAPFFGLPTINIGTRQTNRFRHESIFECDYAKGEILSAIEHARSRGKFEPSEHFGSGNSLVRFLEILRDDRTWSTNPQKVFADLPVTADRSQ